MLKANKLDEPGTFIRLAPSEGGGGEDGARWFCIGSLQKMRPIRLHALVHFLPHAAAEDESEDIVLCLETQAHGQAGDHRTACISTSHQVLHALNAERGEGDINVSVWKSLPARTSLGWGNHFLVQRPADAHDVLGPSFRAAAAPKSDKSAKVAWPSYTEALGCRLVCESFEYVSMSHNIIYII